MKNGQGFVKRVTTVTLEEFRALLKSHNDKLDVEEPTSDERGSGEISEQLKAALENFKGKKFSATVPFKAPKTIKTKRRPQKKETKDSKPSAKPQKYGPILWKKVNLPKSDAQQVNTNTAPTGGLRLTKASWKIKGKVIDQTSYFRNDIFGSLVWAVEKKHPLVEVAEVDFDITIDGNRLGTHKLTIRHKPSGEASQNNYTTLLSWGEVSAQIRQANITGKTFKLYGPAPKSNDPFFIEIV